MYYELGRLVVLLKSLVIKNMGCTSIQVLIPYRVSVRLTLCSMVVFGFTTCCLQYTRKGVQHGTYAYMLCEYAGM